MFASGVALWRKLASWRVRPLPRPETVSEPRRVWLRPATAADESRWPAAVVDASRAGVRLRAEHAFEPGSLLRLETDGPGPQDLVLRVLEADVAADGGWTLQCLFTHELSDADLRAFGARRVSPASPDYRAWVRFPCDVATSCRPVRNLRPPEWPARVHNISANGIGLVVGQEFQPGAVLSVELPGQPRRAVLACVVHATAQGEGEWLLGCSLSAELTADELRAFGAERREGAADDLRAYVRFPCELEMACEAVPAAEPVPVRVLNLSANGIGLVAAQPLEAGTLLSVELSAAGDRPPLTVLACVVYVSLRGDGQWLLGCNFASELSEESLEALR
jgi:hypothetical protein